MPPQSTATWDHCLHFLYLFLGTLHHSIHILFWVKTQKSKLQHHTHWGRRGTTDKPIFHIWSLVGSLFFHAQLSLKHTHLCRRALRRRRRRPLLILGLWLSLHSAPTLFRNKPIQAGEIKKQPFYTPLVSLPQKHIQVELNWVGDNGDVEPLLLEASHPLHLTPPSNGFCQKPWYAFPPFMPWFII